MSDQFEIVGLPHTRITEDQTMCEAWFERKDGPLVKLLLSKEAVSVSAAKLGDASLRLASQNASTSGLVQIHGLSVVAAAAIPAPAQAKVQITMLLDTGTAPTFFLPRDVAIQLAETLVSALQSELPSGDTQMQ
jgi:hypothetical protein